jgi:hypothetical protein
MPRLPVDGKKVIEHRYTLGQYEREQLDTLVTGLTVRNVGTPAVALLNDVTGLLALTAIAEALGLIDLAALARKGAGAGQAFIDAVLAGAYNSIGEALADLQKKIDEAAEAYYPGVAGIPGAPTVGEIATETISLGDRMWVTAQFLLTQPLRAIDLDNPLWEPS